MRLYFKYLSILLKSEMEYATSFWLVLFGQFVSPFFGFMSVYFLFAKFGQVKGWSFFEVTLCFAVINMAFSISECFIRGFDAFSSLVNKGEFDRILVRPRNTVLQVLGSRFELNKLGGLIQGFVVLIWTLCNLQVHWTIFKVLVLIFMVLSGISIFSGIFIMTAAMCFWTIQALELTNILSYGGRDIARYPLDIYKDWVKKFFTFIIPFGTVNYLPLMYLLGKTQGNEILYMLSPVLGMLFVVPCLFIWKSAAKHYGSTGN